MSAAALRLGLGDDGGADLGFALSCLALGIITIADLHRWIRGLTATLPAAAVPAHLTALLEERTPLGVFHPDREDRHPIPHDPFITDERFDAMLALQWFLRPERRGTNALTALEAETALRSHPEVAERFFDLFPFLTEKAS